MRPTKFGERFDRGNSSLSFGDNVRVRSVPSTETAGIAGRMGQIMGETTPSVTGVTVIGSPQRDYAVFVSLKDRAGEHWIDPDLLEFLNHGAGTTMRLKGVSTQWTRTQTGEWLESKIGLLDRIKDYFRQKR